jgi:hypothetical protein
MVRTNHVSSKYMYELAESCIAPPAKKKAPGVNLILGEVWRTEGVPLG